MFGNMRRVACQSERSIRHENCCGAECRLPVRKLSLLAAYITHGTFGCLCVVFFNQRLRAFEPCEDRLFSQKFSHDP